MELQKAELLQKMEEKGISIAAAAERITFDPALLTLYFARDAYPVPKGSWISWRRPSIIDVFIISIDNLCAM